MDKREQLKRKLERIEREETVRRERPQEQGEASAPSTEAASASPPPAPSLGFAMRQVSAEPFSLSRQIMFIMS
jgi:hypothetical protein